MEGVNMNLNKNEKQIAQDLIMRFGEYAEYEAINKKIRKYIKIYFNMKRFLNKMNEIIKISTYHHTALGKGYLSKINSPQIVEYKGKYGKGYKIIYQTNEYKNMHRIDYYILDK